MVTSMIHVLLVEEIFMLCVIVFKHTAVVSFKFKIQVFHVPTPLMMANALFLQIKLLISK